MPADRNKLIAKAFAIKKRLGLTDEVFADLKIQITGIASIKTMDHVHLRAFVAGLDRMQPNQSDGQPADARRLNVGQYKKIIKLSIYILQWNNEQLKSFIAKQTGKSSISWLTAKEAYNVTEALSAMIERRQDGSASEYTGQTRHRSNRSAT
jgi:hypothetical protein